MTGISHMIEKVVIEKTMSEEIKIVKFRSHTIDLLQPLDVACIWLLKRLWQQQLNKRTKQWEAREIVRKALFVNLLSDVWHEGLSKRNIQARFETTGVFPVDSYKYPTNCTLMLIFFGDTPLNK